MGLDDEMDVLGHDDVLLHLHHGIVVADAMQQFFFHHLAYGRELDVGSIGGSVGRVEISCHLTKGLHQAFCHFQRDVVDARKRVIVLRAALV